MVRPALLHPNAHPITAKMDTAVVLGRYAVQLTHNAPVDKYVTTILDGAAPVYI